MGIASSAGKEMVPGSAAPTRMEMPRRVAMRRAAGMDLALVGMTSADKQEDEVGAAANDHALGRRVSRCLALQLTSAAGSCLRCDRYDWILFTVQP